MRLLQSVIPTLVFLVVPLPAALTPEQILKEVSGADIEKALPQEHPSAYYLYAGRLFKEGRKEDAVFWFYVGQLRYRFHLNEVDPDHWTADRVN